MTIEQKWEAFLRSDCNCDGQYYIGVNTTGIFCRPSCTARKPLRKNVRFFDTAEQAQSAGLRPCKRCRPDLLRFQPEEELAQAYRAILSRHYLDDDALAQSLAGMGVSPNHAATVFKKHYRITPHAYINNLRTEHARMLLATTDMQVTHIAFACGFRSLSAFYSCFRKQFGMAPTDYRHMEEQA